MRTTTGPELTTLAATTRLITHRVKVKNGSGTYIDLSSWVESVTIAQDIDQPISGCTIEFRRDSGTTLSLSPLRTDSTLNRLDDGTTYSPQLDLSRAITVEIATTPIGTAPVAGDYKLLFQGTLDTVNFERSSISVSCRDLGAPLVDRWVETEVSYGSVPGEAVEAVMQSILDASFGGGAYPLYTPVSPSYLISPTYQQQRQSVMDAQQALSQLPGWDVRYRWDDGTGTFRFTLSEPPRSKTIPDYTFGPSAYFDVTRLELDITNIRNVITVSYPYAGSLRDEVTVSDSTSITKYGRRYLFLKESDTSPINTSGEATTMANAALADLKDPKAEFEIDAPFFWPADLWDLYRFPTNSVHFNTNQDWAVISVQHTLSRNKHRTVLSVRGQPAGGYLTWLTREGIAGGTGGATTPPVASIVPLSQELDEGFWDLRFDATPGSGGGGVNLLWVIYEKISLVEETILYSGTGATLPKDAEIGRDFQNSKMMRFVVTDTATGLTSTAVYMVPAQHRTVYLVTRARVIATDATTATVRVPVADPYPQGAASATIAYSEIGTGAATSPASGGTVTPAATLTEAVGTYIDYTVTRPASGSGTGRVTFTTTAAGRSSDSDSVEVPEVVPTAITGNAATATKLLTARAINGFPFDGTAAIDLTFASLASKPTTIGGFGITDFNSLGDARWTAIGHTHAFSTITGLPTDLAGYGIVDAANITHSHTFASLTSKPTSLAGYGITNAYTKIESDGLFTTFTYLNDYSLTSHTHTFASLTSKPTTIGGYGITDFNSLGDARWSVLGHTHAFSTITGLPTDLAGYGIVDAANIIHSHTFASLTSKPTSIGGYGITDFNSLGDARWTTFAYLNDYSLTTHTHTFASLTSKPTTISGYGITDFNSLGDARWSGTAHTHTFASLTSKPTTIEGYGITGGEFSGATVTHGPSGVTARNIAKVMTKGSAPGAGDTAPAYTLCCVV